uniref:Ycf34 n=1 Tax=Vertebrata australis TaxID=1967852 RepID=A0A1Z1MI94_9FLOR|nr:hypothetical protein [Vertebrata australis]ARW65763.1 hypothetical protein [Vertebrata australis]
MCICINCRHINKCSIYTFIKHQHYSYCSSNSNKLFNPNDTIIYVSINKNQKNILLDWDLKECTSFVEKPGNWLTFNTN